MSIESPSISACSTVLDWNCSRSFFQDRVLHVIGVSFDAEQCLCRFKCLLTSKFQSCLLIRLTVGILLCNGWRFLIWCSWCVGLLSGGRWWTDCRNWYAAASEWFIMIVFTFISYNNIVNIIWCLFHMLTDRASTMRAAVITPAEVDSQFIKQIN